MPAKVKIKILSCRNLPVMDKSNLTTDAFVEVKLGNITYKTDVKRKSLNPVFNSQWFRFEIDDQEIQDELLHIRVMDYDTYSANDAIGKVCLSLNPLLLHNDSKGLNGWYPIYDTIQGIRGEINFIVKVELFSDANKFRQSSCGVQFFHSNSIPFGYHAVIRGFVEEMIVDDDPEHDWIDKIRRASASNEARQQTFLKLAGQIQRKIGLKAINLGGNAVLGFQQRFDLEKDTIIARGIGTSVTLVKIQSEPINPSMHVQNNIPEDENELLSASPNAKAHTRTESIGCKFSASPSKQQQTCASGGSLPASTAIYRRSSDSDLSITPKGNSLTPGFDRNAVKMPSSAVLKPLNQENMDMLEYPFLTLTKYPKNFIIHLGATVSARSVKLLDKSTNPDDMETRDSWFNELRMEIRGHAKSLGCNVVLGYNETVCVNDDITILSATGTAAIINLHYSDSNNHEDGEIKISKTVNPKELLLATSVEETMQTVEENNQKIIISSDIDEKLNGEDINDVLNNVSANASGNNAINGKHAPQSCNICHIPYSRSSIQVGGANIGKCCVCKRGYVPDVILATIELPDNLQVVGTGCLIQATVCRPKRDLRSESNAKEISDGLPFLEYELHRLLINKLKVKGMNGIFRLNVQVTIGDKIMSLIGTGTAVYMSALHPPVVPKIVAGNAFNESSEKLAELQKNIQNTVEKNRETYRLTNQPVVNDIINDIQKLNKNFSDTEDSDNEEKLDYAIGNKQTCILEIDDIQDLELFNMLMEQSSHEGIKIVNNQKVPGYDYDVENIRNLQMFVQVWRTKMPSSHQSNSNFARHFQRLLQSIFFKLRGAVPCHITNVQFQLDLPQDEIQLLITGMVLKATTKAKSKLVQSISHDRKLDEELIFSLEEEDAISEITSPQNKLHKKSSGQFINSTKMTFRNDKFVDISPLSFVPGAKIEKYLGNLNFCFIRETQNVRDYGGICGFVHTFITELLSIVRAHIHILGGNMLIAYYMTELILIDNPHKNQAQCLVNVGGDAVFCTYDDN
ncbi:hypothetical protein ACKWTF_002655 [Chironomus riparius]